jgi:hypothetical protein
MLGALRCGDRVGRGLGVQSWCEDEEDGRQGGEAHRKSPDFVEMDQGSGQEEEAGYNPTILIGSGALMRNRLIISGLIRIDRESAVEPLENAGSAVLTAAPRDGRLPIGFQGVGAVQGLPIMTSVALMRARAGSPGLRARSRAASAVMMAVMRWAPTASTTLARRPSMTTSTMVPVS